MNHEERQVIGDIFQRLRQVEGQSRDPEAERFIADKVREQPYAPYAMAQSLFIQEQALNNLNAEVQRLRAEVEQLRRQPQGGGGLLSSIFGGSSRAPESHQSHAPQHGSPWGRSAQAPQSYGQAPQSYGQPGYGAPVGGGVGGPMSGPWGGGMQPRAGGGFLQTAMATAAGVAGGMMLGSALSNAFGGSGVEQASSSLAGLGGESGGGDNAGITDSLYQDASANDQDLGGDFGGDGGDGGDWA
jgi:hypothetical protein